MYQYKPSDPHPADPSQPFNDTARTSSTFSDSSNMDDITFSSPSSSQPSSSLSSVSPEQKNPSVDPKSSTSTHIPAGPIKRVPIRRKIIRKGTVPTTQPPTVNTSNITPDPTPESYQNHNPTSIASQINTNPNEQQYPPANFSSTGIIPNPFNSISNVNNNSNDNNNNKNNSNDSDDDDDFFNLAPAVPFRNNSISENNTPEPLPTKPESKNGSRSHTQTPVSSQNNRKVQPDLIKPTQQDPPILSAPYLPIIPPANDVICLSDPETFEEVPTKRRRLNSSHNIEITDNSTTVESILQNGIILSPVEPNHMSLLPNNGMSSPYSASASPNSVIDTSLLASEETEEQRILSTKEAIKERLRLRKMKREEQQTKDGSFPVGLIIRTRIESLERMPPFVAEIKSTDRMGMYHEKYLERASEYCNNFPANECIFVWKEKKLYPSSTPQVLGVTPSQRTMFVQAMLGSEFENHSNLEFETKLKNLEAPDFDKIANEQVNRAKEEAELLNQLEKQRQALNSTEDDNEDEDGYFPISLKGKDNHPITVKVNAETTIQKLVQYFCKNKNIPDEKQSKVRLVFDDEDIDMSGTVGDTELEEDFTVDVYVDE